MNATPVRINSYGGSSSLTVTAMPGTSPKMAPLVSLGSSSGAFTFIQLLSTDEARRMADVLRAAADAAEAATPAAAAA